MVNTKTELVIDYPYKPGWIDRFNNWVEKLPIKSWVFYLAFGIILIVIQILFLWIEGGLQNFDLLPVIIFNGLFVPFLLGLIQLLDDQALAAMDAMKVTLETTEEEFNKFKYLLANMPSRGTLAAGLLVLILATLMETLWIEPIRYAALDQLPTFEIVFQIIDKSSAFLFGVLIYHTIRQLRLVNRINSNHILVNLFNVRPLQAFSKLTATTAVGLMIGIYGWILINPELLADPIIIGLTTVLTITAAAVFIWPLYGIHRLMVIEKEKLLSSLDQEFEAVFSHFNQSLRNNDYETVERLNGTIASLDVQHKKIKAIPTWPWSSETARFALTAIALPLILTIIQFIVGRVFNE